MGDTEAVFDVESAKRVGKATLWAESQQRASIDPRPTVVPDLTPYFAIVNSSTPRVDGGSTIAGCWNYSIEERIPDLDESGYRTWRTPANPKSSSEAITIKEPVLVGMGAAIANGSYILVVPRYDKNGKLIHEFIPAPEGRLEVMNGSSVDQGVTTIAFGAGLVVTSNSSTKVTVTAAGLHLYHDVCGSSETDDGLHTTLKLKSDCCVGDVRWTVSGDNIKGSTWTLNVNDISPATKLHFTSDGSNNVSFTVSSSSGTSCDGKTIDIKANVSLSTCNLTDVDCVTAVQYNRTLHGGMYAKRLSDGKFVPILANEVDVVSDVTWDDTNHKLVKKWRTLYMPALEVSGLNTNDIIVFDEECPEGGGE